MKYITTLIKPSSGNCQLRCKYCFYHSLTENNREQTSYGMMSVDTIEIIIKKAIEEADDGVNLAFQGGEPTLSGLDFFKKVIELEEKYNNKQIKITNSIQTNGIVIDDKWAKFFKDNNFLVGLSLDGTKDIHNMNRVDKSGNGTYKEVIKTADLFDKYEVEYNILFVVTKLTARHINKIYNFFKKKNYRYLQFIPCLDPLGVEPGHEPYSVTNEYFGKFLIKLFNLYYNDYIEGNYVSIRYFDNLIGMLLGRGPEACGMSGRCSVQFVIEADGSVFPCDFYCVDEWLLGNIKEKSYESILNSSNAKEFVGVSEYIDPKCKECKYFNLCRGGCRRTREPFENGKPALQYFCESYYQFFEACYPKMIDMARRIKR